MTRALTNDEFLQRLAKASPKIKPLEHYVNSTVKLKVKCLICGNIWYQTPSELYNCGCPNCKRLKRRLSLSEVNRRIHKKFTYITVINNYIDLSHEAVVHCRKCNRTWVQEPKKILMRKKKGCPWCDAKILSSLRYTNREFLAKLYICNNTIIPLEKYHDSKTPIKVQCKECGFIWNAIPSNLLRGYGCANCARRGPHPSHYLSKEKALDRLEKTHPNIELASAYKGFGNKSTFRCKLCGQLFTNTFRYLMKVAKDCPKCSDVCYSRQESILKDYFDKQSINYQFSYKPLYNPLTKQKLHFDFYLPELNLLIEIQGYQHFQARDFFGGIEGLKYLQWRDQYKKNWAIQNGYCMMYINYNEHTIDTFLKRLKEIHQNYQLGKSSFVLGELSINANKYMRI